MAFRASRKVRSETVIGGSLFRFVEGPFYFDTGTREPLVDRKVVRGLMLGANVVTLSLVGHDGWTVGR